MSQINVNRIKDSNKGAPDFPSGVNVGGITSTVTLGVTNLNPTNVNVSGVVTATTLDGNLLATGTPTLGLGVTINTSGVNISGVATAGIVSATTLYGDGTNLTGIALSIAPLNYNPSINDMKVPEATGIGFTFNQGVKAGSGNVTLSLVSVGSTLVENFSVGSSVSYGDSDYGTTVTISPTSSLDQNTVYALSYPSGAFTSLSGDVSYVGTAYTFKSILQEYTIWGWGSNTYGNLGLNDTNKRSSPTQIPGITWASIGNFNGNSGSNYGTLGRKSDGTLWAWGGNHYGMLGLNNLTQYSSPVQIPGTTWSDAIGWQGAAARAVKTDGTMWVWGNNAGGQLGLNGPQIGDQYGRSSPTQIPGTTWSTGAGKNTMGGSGNHFAIKTDGTLWAWGYNSDGMLGQNEAYSPSKKAYSSPVQVGSDTTWNTVATNGGIVGATKTDGTAWSWGKQEYGDLGINVGGTTRRSSPVQIPGTTWSNINTGNNRMYGYKTDGTLWVWGVNTYLESPQTPDHRSSPTQIPGTTWKVFGNAYIQDYSTLVTKTDGTLWAWGFNSNHGQLGQNNTTHQDSPVQVTGTTWNNVKVAGHAVIGQQLLEE